jgi:hypothetical protein
MGGCSRNIIGRCGLNSSGSGQGEVLGFFEAGNELFGSIQVQGIS